MDELACDISDYFQLNKKQEPNIINVVLTRYDYESVKNALKDVVAENLKVKIFVNCINSQRKVA